MILGDWFRRTPSVVLEIFLAVLAGIAAFAVAAVVCTAARHAGVPNIVLGLVLAAVVLGIARLGGVVYAVPVGVVVLEAFDWYALPPLRTLDGGTVFVLGVSILLTVVVAEIASDAGRRAEASAAEHHDLAAEQAALRRCATLVARNVPSGEIFDAVAREVGGLLRADFAGVIRYEDDGTATIVATWAAAGEHPETPGGWRIEQGDPAWMIADTRQPIRVEDWLAVPGLIAAFIRDVLGVRSSVGCPIAVEGRLWGGLAVHSKQREPLPADTEERVAQFTDLVATAIANAQARSELGRLADEQAALRRVATLVARGANQDEVFAAIAEEIGRVLGTEDLRVVRYDDDGALVLAAWGLPDVVPAGFRVPLDADTVVGRVFRTGRPARIDDYRELSNAVSDAVRSVGIRTVVGAPVVVEGRLWGAMVTARPAEQLIPADTESRLEKFTELVATAIANAESRSQVERLAEEQAALRHVATLVARESQAEEVFATVAREVGRMLGADAAAVWRYEADDTAVVVASWGTPAGIPATDRRWPLDGHSVTAVVYRTGRPARFDAYDEATGEIAAYARATGLRSAVGSPIVVNGQVWGSIGAASRDTTLPADAEVRISEFGELVATAIANLQVRSELAASRARIVATADEERRRVVRDLHDGAQQRLVHTTITLKLAERALASGDGTAADLIAEGLRHAEQATVELRELSHGIMPEVLAQGGLRAGVEELAKRMPVPVEVDVPVGRLPTDVESTAYFVVAETLTNVAKHARADRAEVVARMDDGRLSLRVSDDGCGGARADGNGLVGLSDRLAALGGGLEIRSPKDDGTVISATIPVPPDA